MSAVVAKQALPYLLYGHLALAVNAVVGVPLYMGHTVRTCIAIRGAGQHYEKTEQYQNSNHRISWYLHVQYTRMNVGRKDATVIRNIHPTLLMITFYTFAFWINI